MMKTLGCLLTLFLTAGVAFLGATDKGKAPPWASGDLEASYPKVTFLAAVGAGDTVKSAQADAASSLAQMFTVKIQTDTVDFQRYSDLVKGASTQRESENTTTQTVAVQADEQFLNLRFSDPYTDETGLVHSVAFLERKPTGALYRTRIDKDWSTTELFTDRVTGAPNTLSRYALLDAAYQVGLDAQRMAGQLQIIDPNGSRGYDRPADLQALAQKRDVEAAKLTYQFAIAGDLDGKVAGVVRKTLAQFAFSSNPKGILTVKGTFVLEPVQVSDKYKSLHWAVNLTVVDENGSSLASVVRDARENGVTEAAAAAVVYRELDKQIGKLLAKSIQDTLTRMALKP